MSTTRLDEICIFLVTNVFTSKINALGISNLPTTMQSLRAAWKDDAKRKQGSIVYVAGIFNSLVVVSGLTGRWPFLIKTNAVANILNGVKESIEARKKAESLSEDEVNKEKPRKRSVLSNAIKNRFFSSRNNRKEQKDPLAGSKDSVDDLNDSSTSTGPGVAASAETNERKTAANPTESSVNKRFWSSRKGSKDSTAETKTQAQESKEDESRRKKTLVKAQALLAGKRESSMDDIIWGVFQISLVIFDLTRWQAVGRAWMIFLLHMLEETAFNANLTRQQKTRKIACLAITAYTSERIVFKQQ